MKFYYVKSMDPGGKSDCVAAGPAVPCHRGSWVSYSIPKFLVCVKVYILV